MDRADAARLALRRGQDRNALALANDILSAEGAPGAYAVQAELIAIEALLASASHREAEERLDTVSRRIQPNTMSGTWGEFLRLRGMG